MYITAEHFHFSGVLAVVSGGLLMSYCSHDVFSYSTRLQSQSVWNILVFLLNGVVFILIGLQLPGIVRGLGEYSLQAAIFYAVVISVVTILIRIVWVFPSAYIPRILSKRIRKKERRPTWQAVFIIGWSGMRGVVSLASALAIPLSLTGGTAFPHRNLILFITFTVILFTLVLQGLSLPYLGIQSPAYLQKATSTTNTIVGSGAYVLDSFVKGSGSKLTRRADYNWGPGYATHKGPAHFNEIDFKYFFSSYLAKKGIFGKVTCPAGRLVVRRDKKT